MNILITNDDGINAKGLYVLKEYLESKDHKVFVVAPETEKSGKSHAITLGQPLRIKEYAFSDDSLGYTCSGYPADCVFLGVSELFEEKLDMVISGINFGPNLGFDISYSGTVGAALEALNYNIPSIAVSLVSFDIKGHFQSAAILAEKLAVTLKNQGYKEHIAYNLNVPDKKIDEIKGIMPAFQGGLRYLTKVDKIKDPFGIMYFISGSIVDEYVENSDIHAVKMDYASLTPVSKLRTDFEELERLRELEI